MYLSFYYWYIQIATIGQALSQNEIEKNVNNKCVWYGICDRIPSGSAFKIKNCLYNGAPKALNESGIHALSEWCPHLLPKNYANGDNVYTCCDNAQVGGE